MFEFGPFRVDVLRRSLEREGEPVAVSGKALEILVVLLEKRGEVVGKDTLLREVWPDTAVEENNITVAISGLRKALGEKSGSPKWIVTIPGRGYSFVGEVRSDPPTVAEAVPQTPPILPTPKSRPRTRYLFIAGALLIALAAYVAIVRVTEKAPRSVAILPFEVPNQDVKNDYLGTGLADAVITRLGNTHLVVRPFASVRRFAGRDPIQTGRNLGVDTVVKGTVQTAGNRIRVLAHMFRVRDGKSLWVQTFDVTSDNAFALEDAISERVASSLSGASRVNSEAY